MRRIISIILCFIVGTALSVPCFNANAASEEPQNSFCIYGVASMELEIQADDEIINYKFESGATHYADPYIIPSSKLSEWYNKGVAAVTFYCMGTTSVTLTDANSIIAASAPEGSTTTEIVISTEDGQPLSLLTKFLVLKRMYLFPQGNTPDVGGVTPTPFVNENSDVVVNDDVLVETIQSVNDFQPFLQFIFNAVIPWAGFAGIIILVFATIKFMLGS